MSTPENWSLETDIEAVFDGVGEVWAALRGARLFVTGGTGFIGCWLLESLKYANERAELGLSATVLTRNPDAYRALYPQLADYPAFEFIVGDVCACDGPERPYTHLIHAATDASAHLNETDPRRMFDVVVQGTCSALDFAVRLGIPRVLYFSSGAVYGQQPWEMENVEETWMGAPDCLNARNAYAEGKRAAEMLCAVYAKQFGLEIAIARIFALLGPYLSLDIHFAAGNFIRDAMAGKPVIVSGNGQPCRSYLYAGDLAVWLLHMLVRAESCRPYNVGSRRSVSIKELAELVATVLGNGEFQVLGATDSGWNPGRYVPSNERIFNELGLSETVSLDDAVLRTALWNGWRRNE